MRVLHRSCNAWDRVLYKLRNKFVLLSSLLFSTQLSPCTCGLYTVASLGVTLHLQEKLLYGFILADSTVNKEFVSVLDGPCQISSVH